MRSQANGTVRLASKDPRRHPSMDPNYLSAEQDLIEFRRCIELSRELFAQRAFDPYRGEELAPGADCKTDEDVRFRESVIPTFIFQIDEFVRSKAASAYHPSCTAKMGSSSDNMAVVDGETMGVYGLENLKVIFSLLIICTLHHF